MLGEQLDLNDLRPRAITEDDAETMRRRAELAKVTAWERIADVAAEALSVPGLCAQDAGPIRDLVAAANEAAGRPAARPLQPAAQAS